MFDGAEESLLQLEQRAAQRRVERERRQRARRVRARLVMQTVVSGASIAIRDLAGLAGAGLIAFGTWQIYQPLGIIVGGVLLLAGAWISGARE